MIAPDRQTVPVAAIESSWTLSLKAVYAALGTVIAFVMAPYQQNTWPNWIIGIMCAVLSVVMLARRRVAKRLDWRGMLIDGTVTEKTEEWIPPGSGYGENEGCGNWVVCHLYYRYLDREGHAKVKRHMWDGVDVGDRLLVRVDPDDPSVHRVEGGI
jgi:hypothetical protein